MTNEKMIDLIIENVGGKEIEKKNPLVRRQKLRGTV